MLKDKNDEIIGRYLCPICQCILVQPVTLTKCFHEFCIKCIEALIKNSELKCPVCRTDFEKSDYVIAYDLEIEIENKKVKCKCGQYIPIKEYEEHKNYCNPNDKNNKINTSKYNCTLCDAKNLYKDSYVKHIEDVHSNDHGVCAICSSLPNGKKNYVTYLLGHVDLRHKNKNNINSGMNNNGY